ncbi:ribosomal RNA small subunit methyltransferase E [Clostridia bacterium]|nr:ribosomal RNA small subunit methyltransferase E [Clostridia bacterium]
MAWFFTNKLVTSTFTIDGEDAKHIEKSLRMKAGEELTICDSTQTEHHCTIESVSQNNVTVKVIKSTPCLNEPNVKVTLYQALTKGDKMDTIVQKSVELGVSEIVPIITNRCVSRPDEKSMSKKITRWQKIALQAAKQSRRGIIPQVKPIYNLKEAIAASKNSDCTMVFYELGGVSIKNIVTPTCKTISVFIGSEGGFEESEIAQITENAGKAATLGRRILRAETAPLAALTVIMYQTNNLE